MSDHTLTRRRAVAAISSLAVVTVAGCNETTEEEQDEQLQLVDGRWEATLLGNIDVIVTIRNTGDSRHSGELFAEARISDDTYQTSETVSVAGNSEQTFEVTIDTPFTELIAEDEINVDVWLEE